MRITVFSDFSLRLLMYLGVARDRRATIAEIADRYGVSRAHIMKVALQLGRAGYVETVRGRSGGLRLALPPEALSIGDVLRVTETDFNLVPCFEAGSLCRITPSCVLKSALSEAESAFFGVLDGYTLADLVAPEAALRRDLGLDSF